MLKKKNRSKTFFLRMILAVKSSKEAEKCGKKVTKKKILVVQNAVFAN